MKTESHTTFTFMLLGGLIALTITLALHIETHKAIDSKYKTNHGYVNDGEGNEWQMKRMQTFGIAGEWIAVYRPTSGMRNSEDGS